MRRRNPAWNPFSAMGDLEPPDAVEEITTRTCSKCRGVVYVAGFRVGESGKVYWCPGCGEGSVGVRLDEKRVKLVHADSWSSAQRETMTWLQDVFPVRRVR